MGQTLRSAELKSDLPIAADGQRLHATYSVEKLLSADLRRRSGGCRPLTNQRSSIVELRNRSVFTRRSLQVIPNEFFNRIGHKRSLETQPFLRFRLENIDKALGCRAEISSRPVNHAYGPPQH